MRNKFDTIIIGGGFSGLFAAIVSVKKGKHVALITRGAGTLTIGGGVVDVLGYLDKNTPVNDPFEAIKKLPAVHPYSLLGVDLLKEGLNFFTDLCKEHGYPYESNNNKNNWLPTSVGSLKPTFLRPAMRNASVLKNAKEIVVLGVKGLKDFYPELIIKGLKMQPGFKDKQYKSVFLDDPYTEGRDLNALDMARFVESAEGTEWLVNRLKDLVPSESVVIMPPMLGTSPSERIFNKLHDKLGITCVETSTMPPSVTGLRIREIFMAELRKLKVTIVEAAVVEHADVENGKCTAVYTKSTDKERKYVANEYIVATGGFFGGGNVSEPGLAYEYIFNIPIDAPTNHEEWTHKEMFSDTPHPFGLMGVAVNSNLNPIDKDGKTILNNVKFIGRTLGGYDYNTEKSGNGVALITAYAAGRV